MKKIENQVFGGERPLFGEHDLELDHVIIEPGESALKRCKNIIARNCEFQGKYPFWHVDGFKIYNCLFRPGARAALWYSKHLVMRDTMVEAPKMFREMEDMDLENVQIPDAQETMWHVRGVKLRNVSLRKADYLFMHSSDIDIADYYQEGNYSFQYCKNVVIRNAEIHSKDAFWGTEDVTVYDTTLDGEYLGWHSKRLRLVNCHITGTQPLCYCTDLVMENCTLADDCDLCFEESTLHADIKGNIVSVKNPTSGKIVADSIGEVILDEHLQQPGDCKIEIRNQK